VGIGTLRHARVTTNRVGGRTALVTGAGNGLGRAIALAVAEAGARTVLVGRTAATLEQVRLEVDSLSNAGARVAVCDTSQPAEVSALAAELADEDVSVLINNAGVAGPVTPLVDVEPDDWDEVFAVNVRGVYLMCRAFLPPMIQRRRGDIINVASVSGKRPLPGRTPYTASKMAVIGLTVTLAHEVGPYGVAVNTLSPGPVEGPRMQRNFRLESERTGMTYEQAQQSFVARSALQRMVTEEEVGAAAVAMLSMAGLTGADIDLSAGMVAR
jgi:NAD(P)-dependent dehydrogenase (short-subunit alcohol dehydrogenase family)